MEINSEVIIVEMKEANFDIACQRAYQKAILRFGIDDNGKSEKIDFIRSIDSVQIKFLEYTCQNGDEHEYLFKAFIIRNE